MPTLTTYPTQPHSLPSTPRTTLLRINAPKLLSTIAYSLSNAILFTLSTFDAILRLLSIDFLFLIQFMCTKGAIPGAGTAEQQFRVVLGTGYKKIDNFRNDCFWHFMVWILNPYAIWLFIFWPGWIVVGGAWWWWMG